MPQNYGRDLWKAEQQIHRQLWTCMNPSKIWQMILEELVSVEKLQH